MTEEDSNQQHFKCPHCPCIFLTKQDLERHLSCMGSGKEDHLDCYRRTHGRIEHGSYSTE